MFYKSLWKQSQYFFDQLISWLDPLGYSLGIGDDFEGEPTDKLKGLFGEGHAWCKHASIWIGDVHLNISIYWVTQKYDIERDYQMILGRKIIFEHFDVIFKQKEKLVYFFKH